MRLSDFHTLIDHFSIAFIVFGILAELGGFITRHAGTMTISWIMIRFGLAFAILSVLTGFAGVSTVFIDTAVRPLADYHQMSAMIATALLAFCVVLRMLTEKNFNSPTSGFGLRGAYFALMTLSLVMISLSGFLGMKLVYAHGVGVAPFENLMESLPPVVAPQMPPVTTDTMHH